MVAADIDPAQQGDVHGGGVRAALPQRRVRRAAGRRREREQSDERHVREEIPFYTGKRRPVADLLADLP